ncbi:alpha/beta hydrolase [Simiduia sp. 21SJ11W-1]|uniref:alpha/beta family hydrolase n=1 Tax=Simiduia sp. 21SJ11W-1 TaxID=2909669 RepID=UPI00209F165A|nr:alpha/beta family hydrolase [Simiduia sp. 21SJ11W-1]UTA46572.1 alpha/beta hydrolase [Simiduia sp. 21SJ11W-1]
MPLFFIFPQNAMTLKHADLLHDCLINTPGTPKARMLLAHGAGAPMDSEFMNAVAQGLCQFDVEVVRFEFPYMALRRTTGKRRPPSPFATIVSHFEARVAAWAGELPLFVGGKSMGGRACASLSKEVINSAGVKGALVWGYPLHPVGKPEKQRLAPLQARACELLVLQGERDALGNRTMFEQLALPASVSVQWFADGDHDLKPRKRSGFDQAAHIAESVRAAVEFIHAHL